MSNPSEQRVVEYVGRDDFDVLLWDSGNILDSRDLRDEGGQQATWTDDKDRECLLTGTLIPLHHYPSSTDPRLSYPRYTFRRSDPSDGSVMNYRILARTRMIHQYDQDMRFIPSDDQRYLGQSALVQTVLDSYDEFDYQLFMNGEQQAAFAEIAANYHTNNKLRRLGQLVGRLFSLSNPDRHLT